MTVSRNALATADFATGTQVFTATNNNLTALAGSNVAVFALLSLGNAPSSAPVVTGTCNSVSMTLVGSFWDATNSLGGSILALPIGTLGSSAVQNVTVSWTSGALGASPYLMTIAYNGVDQTTPGQNFGHAGPTTSASASLGITSAINDMAVLVGQANIVTWSSWTTGTNIKNDTAGNQNMFMADIAGASTATITAALSASGVWVVVGCDIKAAGAAAACPHSLMLTGVGCGIWAAKKIEENPILTRRSLLLPANRSLILPRRRSLIGHNGGPPLDD